MPQPQPDSARAPDRRKVIGLALGGLAAGLAGSPLAAQSQDATAETVLTVSGNIARHDGNGVMRLTDAMLAELPQISFRTGTIWTSAPRTYTGPSMLSVLELAGAKGSRVTALAANAYRSSFAISALEDHVPIIARLIDGAPFGLRERGPLWIMYPFDEDQRFRTERHFAQCVWQLTELVVSGD